MTTKTTRTTTITGQGIGGGQLVLEAALDDDGRWTDGRVTLRLTGTGDQRDPGSTAEMQFDVRRMNELEAAFAALKALSAKRR